MPLHLSSKMVNPLCQPEPDFLKAPGTGKVPISDMCVGVGVGMEESGFGAGLGCGSGGGLGGLQLTGPSTSTPQPVERCSLGEPRWLSGVSELRSWLPQFRIP